VPGRFTHGVSRRDPLVSGADRFRLDRIAVSGIQNCFRVAARLNEHAGDTGGHQGGEGSGDKSFEGKMSQVSPTFRD